MGMLYEPYVRNCLKGEAKVLEVDGYRIEYMAFSHEGKENEIPAMVVGGAFQNFNSYKPTVESFLEDRPCIMLDLPSLGNNEQLVPELSGEDMADLLKEFFVRLEIEKAFVTGLSLGSIIVVTFAAKNPQFIARLIVAGVIPDPRESWMQGLKESMRAFEHGAYMELAQAIVLSLMNYARLDRTKMSSTARRLFIAQLMNPNANQASHFEENAARLMNTKGTVQHPECEVLVCTGEYDSFTLPFENADFAAQCPNSRLAFIENADHLPQLQRRKVGVALFKAWVNGTPLEEVEGIKLVAREDMSKVDRRTMPRLLAKNVDAVLNTDSTVPQARKSIEERGLKYSAEVEIVDISFFGCLLKMKNPVDSIEKYKFDLTLQMKEPEFALDLLIFDYEKDSGLLRCLFRHSSVPLAEQWVQHTTNPVLFTEKEDQGVRPA